MRTREAKLGTNHLETADSYNNVGIVYLNKGDYKYSFSFLVKSIKIKE